MSSIPPPTPQPPGTGPLTPVVKSTGASVAMAPRTFWQRLRDGLRAFIKNFL
jgi:hypothetical protein